jgi:hypothetical protein
MLLARPRSRFARGRLAAVRSRAGLVGAGALAASIGAGAALEYFLDPDRGRSRRAEAGDRLAGLARRVVRRLRRTARYIQATGAGLVSRYTKRHPAEPEADDTTLAHKVETELFRDKRVPKGRMNINAEKGTVVLRGVVDSRDEIERILAVTMSIDGVRAVQSLLRTPNEATTRAKSGATS